MNKGTFGLFHAVGERSGVAIDRFSIVAKLFSPKNFREKPSEVVSFFSECGLVQWLLLVQIFRCFSFLATSVNGMSKAFLNSCLVEQGKFKKKTNKNSQRY